MSRRPPGGRERAAPPADLARLGAAIERALDDALEDGAAPPRLRAAIRYAALSPGKRLRPLLALTACQAVGGDWRAALPAAVALECVHAFSLVHDDLPAMDDDDFRRGRLSTHKKYGEAIGILAGDALLARAFEAMASLGDRGVPPARALDATRVLARAAGGAELIAGQVLDLGAQGRRTGAARVRAIHARKTGALIAAALEIGGVLGGASPARRRELRALGADLGLAFQIHDDLLDRRASFARLGKRTRADQRRGKATYPAAVGEERARREAGRLYLASLRRVERLGPAAWNLGHLILAVAER